MPILKMQFEPQGSGKAIKIGDCIMILLKECFIANTDAIIKNHANLSDAIEDGFMRAIHRRDQSEISLSFQFGTGSNANISSLPVGPFTVTESNQGTSLLKDNSLSPVVILPRQTLDDYFSLTANITSTSLIMAQLDTALKIMQSSTHMISNIPLPVPPVVGTVASAATTILGDIMNLIAALNSDHVILHHRKDDIVGKDGNIGTLHEGELRVSEDGGSWIQLEVIKLPATPTA